MSEVSYTPKEVRSFLPPGWMPAAEEGRFDARVGTWTLEVRDEAEHAWTLRVRGADAALLGRLEALRRAARDLRRRTLR